MCRQAWSCKYPGAEGPNGGKPSTLAQQATTSSAPRPATMGCVPSSSYMMQPKLHVSTLAP
eukprot:5710170-Lingulodinium_polyedra.AAC.1